MSQSFRFLWKSKFHNGAAYWKKFEQLKWVCSIVHILSILGCEEITSYFWLKRVPHASLPSGEDLSTEICPFLFVYLGYQGFQKINQLRTRGMISGFRTRGGAESWVAVPICTWTMPLLLWSKRAVVKLPLRLGSNSKGLQWRCERIQVWVPLRTKKEKKTVIISKYLAMSVAVSRLEINFQYGRCWIYRQLSQL